MKAPMEVEVQNEGGEHMSAEAVMVERDGGSAEQDWHECPTDWGGEVAPVIGPIRCRMILSTHPPNHEVGEATPVWTPIGLPLMYRGPWPPGPVPWDVWLGADPAEIHDGWAEGGLHQE